MRFLLCVFVLLAALSPLLTFARLFQIKEWRWDRLREHLRREGRLSQLFGWVRPTVVVIGLITYGVVLQFFDEQLIPSIYILWSTIALLAWFTLFRFVIRRQARPVWTKKSFLIVTLSFVLLASLCWTLVEINAFIVLLLIPLAPFVFVFLSWFLLWPIDRYVKRRITRKAAFIRLKYKNLTVVGITGSVGKTTTKELLSHILSDRTILVTPAHVNTEMGVASLIIRKLREEHQIFIAEMGAYRMGEIALLCSLVKPSIGIITFIGKQHLALFGSQEALCKAKGELFAALPAQGYAFLNADTVFCDELMKRAACPVQTVGTGGHATYEAFDIQEGREGVSFTLRNESFSVPLTGTHQVTNVLLAVGAAEVLGVPIAESAKRLRTFKGPAQTFEKKEGKSGQIVLDDTHNTSPSSFRASVEWARMYNAKTKILVTAGLLELGKEECTIHQELGVLSRGIFDEVIFLSKKCVRSFEQGYGKTVKVVPKQKFKISLQKDMLIICEGRMAEGIVQKLLL
jgi:UDP-N-acetylmuramoyl-tripeptide--D-alanyl-D-alanine ligase